MNAVCDDVRSRKNRRSSLCQLPFVGEQGIDCKDTAWDRRERTSSNLTHNRPLTPRVASPVLGISPQLCPRQEQRSSPESVRYWIKCETHCLCVESVNEWGKERERRSEKKDANGEAGETLFFGFSRKGNCIRRENENKNREDGRCVGRKQRERPLLYVDPSSSRLSSTTAVRTCHED